MTLDEARQIVGRANACEPFLSNMIRALSMLPRLNSDEENRRLEAAKIVRTANRKANRKARP